MKASSNDFEVIVVGAGHGGCEAALAAARMGCRTAMCTLDAAKIALMPCNPSVGGPGKGHLVREIDALGGEIARNTDRTSVQIRLLNTGKGPAVRSLRAQSDKLAYSRAMSETVAAQPNLFLLQASVDDLILDSDGGGPRVTGVKTAEGTALHAPCVVLTTGTFLRGRIIMGDQCLPGGRAGEFPADALSQSLAAAGFTLGRLKTGTPPRILRGSVDWSLTTVQHGSPEPQFLSDDGRRAYEEGREHSPSSARSIADLVGPTPLDTSDPADGTLFQTSGWRTQLNCFLVHTNAETHEVIRRNLHLAPMYNGDITAPGPRYCPSIETKIVRFADRSSHQLFLEPEGWHTDEIYVQGANTSLPVTIQLEMLRTIPALSRVEIARPGYAIEYDYIPAFQVSPTLESKPIRGLFLAGQIIGTTGYEEAGALGIMAGINAARWAVGREAVVLRRDQAYIGVLVDDLVTKPLDEPYRMHTSQAEYRLLLREDSAGARLSYLSRQIGLLDEARYAAVAARTQTVETALESLEMLTLTPSEATNRCLVRHGARPLSTSMTGLQALRRNDMSVGLLVELGLMSPVSPSVAREIETRCRYEGYINRQASEVRRLARMEERGIPNRLDYTSVRGLRAESVEKLQRVRPRTIGQASRIGGVPPSDVALILFHLEKRARLANAEVPERRPV